ncbi:MAG: TetR/AcrR family transcriptional regulator [Cellulomonas sp.]|nr:TetR/AcrR family transcriptional regulator [Cellulomonas sp.]
MSRPRDDQLDEAIHRATVSLLAEVGYDGVTITEVARRASTVPPTMYRRHANARELVLATLRREFADVARLELADLGDLRADLLAFVATIAAALTPERAAILAGLMLPLRREPELAATLREELGFLDTTSWQVIIRRAVDRAELPERAGRADLSLVASSAPALIFHRVVVLNLPLDNSFAVELVDAVLLPALRTTAAAQPADRAVPSAAPTTEEIPS